MDEKLKPCPFCGHENPMIWYEKGMGWGYCITCRECAAKIGGRKSRAEIIKAWNRRSDDDKR